MVLQNDFDNAVQQARCWAQEARTQASIVREIYAHCGVSHLGDWNGARPIMDYIERLKATASKTQE